MDHFWWTIKRGIVRHPILNGGIVLVMVTTIGLWIRKFIRARGGGSIKLGEKSDSMGGLLNGNFQSQGKVD